MNYKEYLLNTGTQMGCGLAFYTACQLHLSLWTGGFLPDLGGFAEQGPISAMYWIPTFDQLIGYSFEK